MPELPDKDRLNQIKSDFDNIQKTLEEVHKQLQSIGRLMNLELLSDKKQNN